MTGTAQSYTFNAADDQNAPVLTVGDGTGAIDLSEAKSIRAKAKAGQTLIDGSVKTDKDIVVVVETPTGDFTYNVEAGTGNGMGITSGGLQIGESTISGKGEANTNSKTLSEAFLGSVAFVNQGQSSLPTKVSMQQFAPLRALPASRPSVRFTAESLAMKPVLMLTCAALPWLLVQQAEWAAL